MTAELVSSIDDNEFPFNGGLFAFLENLATLGVETMPDADLRTHLSPLFIYRPGMLIRELERGKGIIYGRYDQRDVVGTAAIVEVSLLELVEALEKRPSIDLNLSEVRPDPNAELWAEMRALCEEVQKVSGVDTYSSVVKLSTAIASFWVSQLPNFGTWDLRIALQRLVANFQAFKKELAELEPQAARRAIMEDLARGLGD
jgi:hypothetical protein